MTTIGEDAFLRCKNLKEVVIPESVTMIEKDSFWECNSLFMQVNEGSYAHQYAIDKDIQYTAISDDINEQSAHQSMLRMWEQAFVVLLRWIITIIG